MSIEGGLPRAVDRALRVDATALQIFVKSSNQWAARPFRAGEAEGFRDALGASGLAGHVMAHASYLINVASPERALRDRSVRALGLEIDRCAELGVPMLVLHPGAHMGAGAEAGMDRAAHSLGRALGSARRRLLPGGTPVRVLLELTAGQGTQLGSRFEELGGIIDRCEQDDRLGICFDTCHAWAAGHDFRDAAGFRATFAALARTVGIERLGAFHLNDSRMPLGSRRDRHEHIGDGTIGLEGFRRIVRDRRFRDLPMVLETPKGPDLREDRRNLRALRALARR